jgi:exodeoxyribonuclease V beta subunit
VQQHKEEETDDELRLTYVALTRAQSHLLVWWAPTTNTPTSPLHRLLLHDGPELAPQQVPVPSDSGAVAAFRERAERSDGGMGVEVVGDQTPSVWSPAGRAAPKLALARFDRALDTGWRRTSYTALTSAAHEQRLGSEPEAAQKDDETDLEEVPAESTLLDVALRDVVSAWDAIPGGAAFGTLVHAAVERIADLGDDAEVASVVTSQVARWAPELDAPLLTRALSAAFATPLGPLTDGAALSGVPATDRLPELDFELPLAGGDGALDARVLLSQLVPLWRRHVPSGQLSAYADALAELPDVPLRGYLTGSIDAVLRVGDRAAPRYLVVDYKTNRLGGYDEPLTAWHYRSSALETAMVEAHYPLQALLYSVALHRYLRWRQPGYDPGTHLGGVLYLFLRGMTGPDVVDATGAAPGGLRPGRATLLEWRMALHVVTGLAPPLPPYTGRELADLEDGEPIALSAPPRDNEIQRLRRQSPCAPAPHRLLPRMASKVMTNAAPTPMPRWAAASNSIHAVPGPVRSTISWPSSSRRTAWQWLMYPVVPVHSASFSKAGPRSRAACVTALITVPTASAPRERR